MGIPSIPYKSSPELFTILRREDYWQVVERANKDYVIIIEIVSRG